ncbi:MAG TPA: ABC transporter permease [Puia sp.]|jgi:ABC-type antimicrobial peptide transport system permease subunit
MLRNYFKIAWRTLLKSRGYSALNILGLAIGMSVALLIGLWVYNEYSYDKFLPGYQQLYQVRRNFNSNGDTLNFTSTSLKLADALRSQVPEIQYVAATDGTSSHGLMVGDKKLYRWGVQAQSDFLKMFQYPFLQGNAAGALKDPYSIVLTESIAKALFGAQDPMNKTVRIDNKNDLKVTGILKDLPANSTFQFGYVVPFSYLEATAGYMKNAHNSFGNNSYNVFAALKPGITAAQVAPKIRGIEWTETNNTNAMLSAVVLQPMTQWHLYGNYINGKDLGGFLEYVRMFSIIGLLVLFIACINFVNLTTARSEKRAREVGVRKAIGSERKDLIFQFLMESVLLTFLAFLVSLLFVQIALTPFNALTGNHIVIPFSSGGFWAILLGCVLITAIASGSRPAFYLSSFNPVKVLKGSLTAGRSGALPRKILVVLQFSCSIALIISTIIVYQQIGYAEHRPTGYRMDRMMETDINHDLGNNFTALKNELLSKGIVETVTTATCPVTNLYSHTDIDKWPGKKPGETIEMGTIQVSDDYFKSLGIPIIQGRDFRSPSDTMRVIFNETAIRQMRIKNPIGQVITYQGTPGVEIIGVAKDALMASPFAPADPTVFLYDPHPQYILLYRLSQRLTTQEGLAQLTTIFNKYNPAYPYTYAFVDQRYAEKFKTEVLVEKLSGIFAGLAIFISCLGLFGLAAFVAEQRTREIGIRKVLGASVSGLWMLLSKDFIVLVLISCVLASPVAFFFLHNWLQQYSYRIDIGAGVFVLASATAIGITLVTISFQAIKAAVANPVKSLRSE